CATWDHILSGYIF
nr:immunoglobulin light chain junction region [Macaca mulatta]